MNSKRLITIMRCIGAAACLAGIVTFYRLVVHANQTTVALTLLLLILFIAARWGLRFSIGASLVATACYNFFFLPPLYKFTVSDPQNLVALAVFLITAVFASRLSHRIRAESSDARARQSELEILYSLSRDLLQSEELTQLTNSIPASVTLATGSNSVLFYLLEGNRSYRAGLDTSIAWPPTIDTTELHELAHAPGVSITSDGAAIVPLRTGVKPRGLLILRGVKLSTQTLEALGGLVSVALDRVRAVEEVAHVEAAQESERLRSMILDSITHELRTPVASIKTSIDKLLEANAESAESHELLTEISEQNDRLDQLVTEAVEMAQLDTQQVSMDVSPQQLSDMIDAAIETAGARLADHEIIKRIPEDLPCVVADPLRIEKVIYNLLENAAKYSAPGQPIYISVEVRGQCASCSIADRGIGIDPAEQPLVFDKLYRSRKRTAHIPGTGMGLAICRAIVEAHNGTISVTSQPGQGSVFTFTLPLA
ncbi:sensor histidine kinase [Granulicella mallensis]|nr:ATP-binding protein [Granulicella mallensis]